MGLPAGQSVLSLCEVRGAAGCPSCCSAWPSEMPSLDGHRPPAPSATAVPLPGETKKSLSTWRLNAVTGGFLPLIGDIKVPLPVQEDQPTGGGPTPGGQEEEEEGERQWRRWWGRRYARHALNPPLQPGPGALPHQVQLRTWSEQLGHIPCPQQRARASAPRGRAGEGTRDCNRSLFPARGQASAGSVGSGGLLWDGSPRAGGSLGHPSSQPACPGIQVSAVREVGWGGGGRRGQDPNEELTCSPSSPAAFPLPKPGPASRREGVTRHPEQP